MSILLIVIVLQSRNRAGKRTLIHHEHSKMRRTTIPFIPDCNGNKSWRSMPLFYIAAGALQHPVARKCSRDKINHSLRFIVVFRYTASESEWQASSNRPYNKIGSLPIRGRVTLQPNCLCLSTWLVSHFLLLLLLFDPLALQIDQLLHDDDDYGQMFANKSEIQNHWNGCTN